MKLATNFLGVLLWLSLVPAISGQEMKAANPVASPPSLIVLVHQETQPGRMGERQKLLTSISHACDRFDTPNFWIDLQSLTGARETLTFSPFDSFDHMQQAHAGWRQFYTTHSDLARTQAEIDALVSSERTIIAVRRDDLSTLAENIDLSEARYLRVIEVRLFPGHENDFAESVKLWTQARTKIKAENPWVIYQVNEGASSPTFLVLFPLSELKENDDLLSQKQEIQEGNDQEGISERLKQIARESFISTESNLYVVHPETSHVPREFVGSDSGFWRAGTDVEPKPDTKTGAGLARKKPQS